MKKVYILLEKVFNYDAGENIDSCIDGVYNTKEKAIKQMQEEIKHNIEDFSFVEDTDNATKELNKILFYDYQENWQNFIEFEIIDKEIF